MDEPKKKRGSALSGTLGADFYQNWRDRVRKWAEGKDVVRTLLGAGLAAPDLIHLLVKLMADPRVPLADKAKMGFAVAYVASPVDLLPEIIFGPAGMLDDFAVVAWALKGLLREEHWDVITDHWAGEEAALDLLRKTIEAISGTVGSSRWQRLKGIFSSVEDALPSEDEVREAGKKVLRVLPKTGERKKTD